MKKIKAFVSILGAVEDKKIVAEAQLSPPYVSRIRKGLNIDSFSKNMKALIEGYKIRKYRKSPERLKKGAEQIKAQAQGKDPSEILGVSALLAGVYWTYKEIDGRLTLENKKRKLAELIAEQEASGEAYVPQMVLVSFWEYVEKQLNESASKKRGRKKRSKRASNKKSASASKASMENPQASELMLLEQETMSSSHTNLEQGALDAPVQDVEHDFSQASSECTSDSEKDDDRSTFKNAKLFLINTRDGEVIYVHGDSLMDAVSTLVDAGIEAVKFEEFGNILVRS